MVSKVLLALCVVVAVAAAIPAGPAFGGWPQAAAGWPAAGANSFMPPWLATAPWMPQWTACSIIGSDCLDCNTKVVCTKVGGIQKVCSDPTLPHCNAGECSATPSAACSPAAVPAAAGAV